MESVHFVLIKYLYSLLARFRLFAYLRLTENNSSQKNTEVIAKKVQMYQICVLFHWPDNMI